MRRLRLIFLVLVVLLAAPLGWLFAVAWESLDTQDRDSFRRLAEFHRVQADRALAAIVAREESRTPCDFAPLRVPIGLTSDDSRIALQHSPLSGRPADPAIVGYFALLEDGALVSPHRRLDGSLVEEMSDSWPRLRAAAADVTRADSTGGLPARARPEAPAPIVAAEPEVSSTDDRAEKPASSPARDGKGGLDSTPPPPRYWPRDDDQGARRSPDRPLPPRDTVYWRAESARAIHFFTALTEAIAADSLVSESQSEAIALRAAGLTSALRLDADPMRILALAPDSLIGMRRVWIGQRQVRLFVVIDAELLVARALAHAGLAVDAGGVAFLVEYSHTAGVNSFPLGSLESRPLFMTEFSLAAPFDCLRVHCEALQVFARVPRAPLVAAAIFMVALGGLGVLAVDRAIVSLMASAERRQAFVSSVTHELKTPLTTIRLYAEMLRDGVVADETKRAEYHQAIVGEAERLTRLIGNVLDLAKLERRAHSFQRVPCDATLVIDEVVALLNDLAAHQGFTLSREIEPATPLARCDRDALKQILINVIDNALKFAQGSEPRIIHVRASHGDPWVIVEVVDHGPGIPSAELPRIGQPFTRGDDTQARAIPGTGLGLSLVRLLASGMGARFELANHESGGLVARLFLPIAEG